MKSIVLMMNNINIKRKLIISYLLVVFIPVLLIGIFLTYSLRQMAMNHATQQSINNVDKIKKRTEEVLKIPTDISSKIYSDKKLKSLVRSEYGSTLEVVMAYNDYTDFTDDMRLYNELSGIRFYSENQTLLNNWSIFKIDLETIDSPWFIDGLKNRGKIAWDYIPDATRQNNFYLSLSREIFYDDMSFCGMLIISLKTENLNSIVSQEPFETMILTDQDEIVAAKDVSLVGNSLKTLHLDKLFGNPDTGGDIIYQGKPAKVITQTIQPEYSKNALRIVSIIPLESILGDARKITSVAFTIIFASLLFSILMILFFSGALSKRTRLLSKDIRMVALGDLSITSVVSGGDEIGQLARHFNYMVRSIENLMREVNEANLQKNSLLIKQKEITLKMLANQINPHFLFNVLETIRMKAHVNGEEEIANIVKSLGKLLRRNLEIGHDPVPLAEELNLVRNYLEIQKFQFGEKIEYVLPSNKEAEGLIILPMLLQPIVENAIIHGLENKIGKGRITVTLEKGIDTVRLIVADDGIGIEEVKLIHILQSLDKQEEEQEMRIGLRNVHQRLKLHYGPDYGLELISKPGFGTCVTMILPAGGDAHV
jgi:two-component system sensor histidine kinase YesM